MKFTGDIVADTNVTIDGEMVGRIKSTRHVSLGATSRFEGGGIESESALVSVMCGAASSPRAS
ncbi:polymer-forming cytoskeletal protein [Alistipes sp.]|uniref:polymer-forming cytoskeletal protein n=1 Tax=Alistipes sp. TaxID=1872444 RepID=UPI003AEFD4E4